MKVVIVEGPDELRSAIRDYLRTKSKIEVIHEVRDGSDVLRLIKEDRPDVIFFGVESPAGKWSTVVYRLVGTEQVPSASFRLNELLTSGDSLLGEREWYSRHSPDDMERPTTLPFRLMGKLCEIRKDTGAHLGDTILVVPEEIMFAEARGNTLYVHTPDAVAKIDSSLQELEQHLRASGHRMFFRCHKSYLINLLAVKGIRSKVCDSYDMAEVFFQNIEKAVPVSRHRKGLLIKQLRG